MPTYDYHCDANDQVLEVQHRISEELKTWGELAERAGVDLGDTPVDSPVKRLATGGQIVSGGSGKELPPMPSGGCCGGGACGIH